MKLFGAVCLTGMLALSAKAGTVTLFDNTTQSVTGQDSVAAAGTGSYDGNAFAGPIFDQFITDSNATGDTLTSLTFSLIAGDITDGQSINVGLYTDNSGNPGTLIGSFLGTASDAAVQQCVPDSGVGNPDACGIGPTSADVLQQGTLVTISGLSVNLLTPSTQYWIGLSDPPSSSMEWDYAGNGGGIGTGGEMYNNTANGNFDDSLGPYIMQVLATDNPPAGPGSPTPEPASFLLFGGGALAVGLFRRKIRSN